LANLAATRTKTSESPPPPRSPVFFLNPKNSFRLTLGCHWLAANPLLSVSPSPPYGTEELGCTVAAGKDAPFLFIPAASILCPLESCQTRVSCIRRGWSSAPALEAALLRPGAPRDGNFLGFQEAWLSLAGGGSEISIWRIYPTLGYRGLNLDSQNFSLFPTGKSGMGGVGTAVVIGSQLCEYWAA